MQEKSAAESKLIGRARRWIAGNGFVWAGFLDSAKKGCREEKIAGADLLLGEK